MKTTEEWRREAGLPAMSLQSIDFAPKGKWILVLDEHHIAFWQACWSKDADCFMWADGKMKLKRPAGWIPMPEIIKEN